MMSYTPGSGPLNLRMKSLADPANYYPTGRCFDNALDYVTKVVGKPTDANFKKHPTLYLVHAICSWTGHEYAHAWAEHEGQVIEGKYLAGRLVYLRREKETFYAEMKVKACTRYSARDADKWNEKTNHFGPWEIKYIRRAAQSLADFT